MTPRTDPLPRAALVVALLVGGCIPSEEARPPGCATMDEAAWLVGTYATQVLVGAWNVTAEIDTDHALAVASQVDLVGWGSLFQDILLFGWCETPGSFDPTCSALLPGAEVCVAVTCDGLNAATIRTTVTPVDAEGTPRAAFAYAAVNAPGLVVHGGESSYAWSAAPDGEHRFDLEGRYESDVLWMRPGLDAIDLSSVVTLTTEQVSGEVGEMHARIELPGIEPGALWVLDIVDTPEGTDAIVLRDEAPAGHLEWRITTDEEGHPYPYLHVVLDGACEGGAQ